MNNTTKKAGSLTVIYAIITLVYIILFALIPFEKRAASWIGFIFALVSLAASWGITAYAFSSGKSLVSKVYGFPVFRIGYLYAAAQFAVCVVVCVIAAFVSFPAWIVLLVSLLLLAAAAIGFIATDNTRDFLEEMDAATKAVTRNNKVFSLNVNALVDTCSDADVKKELQKLAEAIRYSDPVSSDATADIEARITASIDALDLSAAKEESLAAITGIKNLLTERNRICKLNK